MCGIAGVVSANGDEISLYLNTMLKSMQHRGPDGAGIMIGGEVQHEDKLEDLDFAKKGKIGLGHVRLAITGGALGLQPFQSKDGKLSLLHNGEIYNYKKLRQELSNETQFETNTDSEVIIRLTEKHYQGNLTDAFQKILPQLDGVWAIAITDNEQTIIARDKLGVRQIYYHINQNTITFASEKKPLWAISGKDADIKRLLPGHMAVLNDSGIKDIIFWSSESIKPDDHIENRKEAIETYGKAIQEAVRKRIDGKDHVGIIFSGGIDSFLIAYEVQKLGVGFTCYTAGREGATDIQWAIELANQYNFPLKVKMLSVDDIEKLIPEIIQDIEDYSLNQVEVSVPIYASVRMAQENGERVILSGQGADELFGGYPWYPTIVDREGYESFEKYSWDDAFLLYKECLEREDKISMAHSIELRVPFLDPEVVKVAFRISPKLKIDKDNDSLGKRTHREYCVSRGIPETIAFRMKEAAQHGANVHNAFEELANRKRISATELDAAGYDPNQTVTEKLGSSSRYGYRYGDHHLWKPLPQVQYYLDSVANSLDLLLPAPKQHIDKVNQKLEELSSIGQKGLQVRRGVVT